MASSGPKESLRGEPRTEAGKSYRLRMAAIPSAVPRARRTLAKVASDYGADSFAVQTVVGELVGNAVEHAYPGVEPGLVLVTARSSSGLFLVAVADDGGGMKLPSKDTRFGLGLRLSAKLTDELRIESNQTGTTVFASFPLPQTD